jgi:tripartite-type tricarboxylate transporter receptor subunit TctC
MTAFASHALLPRQRRAWASVALYDTGGEDVARTRVLSLAVVAVSYASFATAQPYPTRVIRYVVSDAPGSGLDTLARIIAEGLTARFGQQVVVDNRPGAGGNIGAEVIARATPDGYTIGQIATTHTVNATLYRKLGYDLVRDLTGITQLASVPSIAVVPASSQIKSIADLVKNAKSKPGGLTYASAGTGTCTFLAGELFKREAGVDLMHVAYKGGPPAVTSILSGETSVYFAPLSAVLPLVRQGRLQALGVSTPQRLTLLPEQPTISEAGVAGYQFSCWYGLVAPSRTPRNTISILYNAVTKVLADATVQKRLNDLGFIPVGDKPEAFTAHIKAQVEAFRPIVKGLPKP